MPDRRLAAAWALALAAALLLAASMTGAGYGPFGVVLFGHMAFSYVLVATAFVVILLLARPQEAGA